LNKTEVCSAAASLRFFIRGDAVSSMLKAQYIPVGFVRYARERYLAGNKSARTRTELEAEAFRLYLKISSSAAETQDEEDFGLIVELLNPELPKLDVTRKLSA
jgi:hypothetical protein